MLFGKDFEVHKARDGIDGIHQAIEFQPDLILLDVMLPRISGIEVLRQLQNAEETSSIPVIIVTAAHFEEKDKVVLQREPNVSCFLSKSCGSETLLDEVHDVVGDPGELPG